MKLLFWQGGSQRVVFASRRRSLSLQALESREVPTLNPTGAEQEMLELLNNMRTDPQGHFSKLVSSTSPLTSTAANVTSALDYFNVDGALLRSQWNSLTAVQPLAWNDNLMTAAGAHNQAMIAQDNQSHQLPGEQSLGARITSAGYSNWTNVGENIYAYADDAFFAHAGFAIDWGGSAATGGIQSPAGHRLNMMSSSYREVGIRVTAENNPNTSVGPQVVTQDFGNRSGLSGGGYLLGVVYDDLNANSFYNAGEGLGSVSIQVTGANGFNRTLSSMTAGGYQTFLSTGTYEVTFSGGGLASPVTKSVTVGTANVKVDVVSGVSGSGPGNSTPNSAPVLNIAPAQTLKPIATNDANPAGTAVSALINGVVTDANSGDTQGIAIVGSTGSNGGAWQFSTDGGGSWFALGTPGAASARLLGPTNQVRFLPNAGFAGVGTLVYKAWDGSAGTAGQTANAGAGGGTSAFSLATETATLRVQTAPTLDTTKVGTFPNIAEDATNPAGVNIARLLGTGFTDPNSNVVNGAAITSLTNTTDGVWQYRFASTTLWRAIGTVSDSSAFLLRGIDFVRFVPNANFNGTASLGFHAWDRSQGTLAGRWNLADSGNVGGGTAFGTQTATITQTILPVNDAPVLNAAANPAFGAVSGLAGSTSQSTVASLIGAGVTDVDAGAQTGMAIYSVTKSTGYVWEYSTDGGSSWLSLNSSSPLAARLLRGTDLIRIRVTAAVTSPITARLAFRAWDQTQGSAGGVGNISSISLLGGRTAFSRAADLATVAVG